MHNFSLSPCFFFSVSHPSLLFTLCLVLISYFLGLFRFWLPEKAMVSFFCEKPIKAACIFFLSIRFDVQRWKVIQRGEKGGGGGGGGGCSPVWDVESQLPSRLCVCSLGRHGGGVRRAVAPPDREPFYWSTDRAVNQETEMGPETKRDEG